MRGVFIADVTERKLQQAAQQRMIAEQQDMLRELSTPLLPIADGVLILDVTGIRQIDSDVARALVDAARAARLVGARGGPRRTIATAIWYAGPPSRC